MKNSTYLMRKKDMIFQNINALKTVEHVIAEIDQGLGNKSRTINDSSMPEVLATAIGIGSGSAISFAALYLSGSVVGVSAAGVASALSAAGAVVGGGATTGLFVLAAPIAILGFLGIRIAKKKREKRQTVIGNIKRKLWGNKITLFSTALLSYSVYSRNPLYYFGSICTIK